MTDITTAAVSGGVLAGGCPEIAAAFDAYQGQVEQSATHSLSPSIVLAGCHVTFTLRTLSSTFRFA